MLASIFHATTKATITMSNPYLPSKALLRALLEPHTIPRCTMQARFSSTYMPRHKYAAVTRLDKLHRTQKAAMRQESKFLLPKYQLASITFTSYAPQKTKVVLNC